MRLDKFLSETGTASRSESKKTAARGGVMVDGIPVHDLSCHITPEKVSVTYLGVPVAYRKNTYLMLNKPDGILSATEDNTEQTVLDLVPEKYRKIGLFPCGRLDKNTFGLLILTDNGALAHCLLSPKHHVEKTYHFRCAKPLSEEDEALLCRGVDIGEKKSTRPATLSLVSSTEGDITVVEGKYHQIKRMFEAVDNRIIYLERTAFAGIPLDRTLPRGGFRELTEEETALLEKAGN